MTIKELFRADFIKTSLKSYYNLMIIFVTINKRILYYQIVKEFEAN